MKLKTITTAAALAVAVSGSAVAQTAESNVVGFETLTFNSGFNFLGVRLHESVVASGSFDGDNGTDSTDSTGDFSGLAAGTVYIVELADGTVVEADGALLTGANPSTLAGTVVAGDYEIRPADTLSSLFGDPAGAANNTPFFAAGSAGSADQVWVPDGAGSFDKYYVNTNFGVDDWFTVSPDAIIPDPDGAGPLTGADTVVLSYLDAFIVQGVGTGNIIVDGDLKTAPTSVGIGSGFQFLGGIYPEGTTLATQFGDPAGAANNTSFFAAGSAGSADQVWIPDGAGSFNKYYVNTNFGVDDWFTVTPDAIIPDPDGAGPLTGADTVGITSGYVVQSVGPKNVGQDAPTFYAGL